jgi:hypothetical protein
MVGIWEPLNLGDESSEFARRSISGGRDDGNAVTARTIRMPSQGALRDPTLAASDRNRCFKAMGWF